MPAPDGSRQRCWPRAGGVRAGAARAEAGRGHRHDVPRRAPVAAGHPRAHPRPACGRRARRAHDAAAVDPGGVGRCDVRRGAAVPVRGPVGAARRAARGGAEHLPADAAARPQHGRLHAVPDRGHRGVRARGRRHRHRHLPDLRRAQRRRADASGHRGGARDRHGGRRGRALLHRRPVRTRREALHARLLPAARRADRRRRRARARDQGHGRAAAGTGRAHPGPRCASGSTCRCTCTPTTPPAASSRRCSPRSTPASTRSTPRAPRWPAPRASPRCRRWWRRPTTPTARPASTSRRSATSSPTGRPPAASTRPSSPGCPRRPVASTATRSPAASSPTCGSRRSPSGSGRSSSRSRTCTPPPTTSSATSSRSRRRRRSSATSRCTWSRSAPTRRSSRRTRRFDVPDSVIGFLSGDLGDPPGGWPEPFRTKALDGRTVKPAVAELDEDQRAGLVGPSRHPQRAAVPRADQGVRRVAPEVRRHLGAADRRLPLRPPRRRGAPGRARGGQDAALRAQAVSEADERGIRTVMCTINGQLRPVNVRDRSVAADAPTGEGRHRQAGPRRRTVRRRGHAAVGRGRPRSRPAPRWRPSRR